jgi:hypothetical protein
LRISATAAANAILTPSSHTSPQCTPPLLLPPPPPARPQFPSDDINKFLWPVRIGSGVFGKDMPSEGDFMSDKGQYDVGPTGSKILHNCLAYKLSYYRCAAPYVRFPPALAASARAAGGGRRRC